MLNEAGVWKIKNGERIVDQFPVNVDARESDIRRVGRVEIERVLGDGVRFLTDNEHMQLQSWAVATGASCGVNVSRLLCFY